MKPDGKYEEKNVILLRGTRRKINPAQVKSYAGLANSNYNQQI